MWENPLLKKKTQKTAQTYWISQKVSPRNSFLYPGARGNFWFTHSSSVASLSFLMLSQLIPWWWESCFLSLPFQLIYWATWCGRETRVQQYPELFYFVVHTRFLFSASLKLGLTTWLVIAMKRKQEGHGSLLGYPFLFWGPTSPALSSPEPLFINSGQLGWSSHPNSIRGSTHEFLNVCFSYH